MPLWILLSLLFPALTGVVNIFDKLIVDRYSSRTFYYEFWIGVVEMPMGLLVYGVGTSLEPVDAGASLGGALTGFLAATALMLFLGALKFGQVARVVPIWFLYPLMVAPMAAGLLGQDLSAVASVAVVLAVLGAVLVTWQGGRGGHIFGDHLVLALALGAAAFLAGSFITSKHFLEGDDLWQWQFFGAYRLGFAPTMLAVVFLPGMGRNALAMVKHMGFMGMILVVEALVTLVLVVRFAAISQGEVALVSAISAVQPALVFVYSLGLSLLWPAVFSGWITRGTLLPQAAGIASITGSVVLITLQ